MDDKKLIINKLVFNTFHFQRGMHKFGAEYACS